MWLLLRYTHLSKLNGPQKTGVSQQVHLYSCFNSDQKCSSEVNFPLGWLWLSSSPGVHELDAFLMIINWRMGSGSPECARELQAKAPKQS